MTSNNDSLDLDTVVKRFADAEDALSKVKTHLESLGSMRESEEKNAASLADAANQISGFVNAATAAMDELKSAQQKVVDILKNASDILDGTELKTISGSVDEVSKKVNSIEERNTASDTVIKNLTSKVEQIANNLASLEENTTTSSKDINFTLSAFMKKIEEMHQDVKEPIIVKKFF